MSLYLKLFNTTSAYTAYTADTENFVLPNVSLIEETNGVAYHPWVDPCASEKVKTTYEWVEIGGVKWATKNVGALTVTDYGQKFSWGGVNGYTNEQVSGGCHAFSWADYELGNGGSSATDMTKYNSTDKKTVLEAVDDAATVNMGSGWKMPTEADFNALSAATTNAWVTDYKGSGVNGRLFTDKTDSSKVLFFPAAGRCSDGSVNSVGSNGYYWSSSLYTSNVVFGRRLYFDSGDCYISNYNRRSGCAVRGVVG